MDPKYIVFQFDPNTKLPPIRKDPFNRKKNQRRSLSINTNSPIPKPDLDLLKLDVSRKVRYKVKRSNRRHLNSTSIQTEVHNTARNSLELPEITRTINEVEEVAPELTKLDVQVTLAPTKKTQERTTLFAKYCEKFMKRTPQPIQRKPRAYQKLFQVLADHREELEEIQKDNSVYTLAVLKGILSRKLWRMRELEKKKLEMKVTGKAQKNELAELKIVQEKPKKVNAMVETEKGSELPPVKKLPEGVKVRLKHGRKSVNATYEYSRESAELKRELEMPRECQRLKRHSIDASIQTAIQATPVLKCWPLTAGNKIMLVNSKGGESILPSLHEINVG